MSKDTANSNLSVTQLKNRLFLAMFFVSLVPLFFWIIFIFRPISVTQTTYPFLKIGFMFGICLGVISLVALWLSKRLAKPIEELRTTQNQLIQSAKLASVGTLAAGVAHELNQCLMVIRGYSQMLLDDLEEDNSTYKDLRQIERQTSRMMKIISQLKDFSRQSRGDFKAINIKKLIDETLVLLQQQLKNNNIELEIYFSDSNLMVWGDITQLEQVFINLIINAQDAIMAKKESGKIIIRIFPDQASQNQLNIEVIDSGVGIEQDIQNLIFDPFFTSKEVGKGTGLGLAISYGLVKEHGGWLEFESTPGQGSLFRVKLPIKS